jgi:hypothetical protein
MTPALYLARPFFSFIFDLWRRVTSWTPRYGLILLSRRMSPSCVDSANEYDRYS